MAELKPRVEHVKPQKTDLARYGVARWASPKQRLPAVEGKIRPPTPRTGNPIGVLFDASVTVKFREGTGVRIDAAQGSFVRAMADKERAGRLARLGLDDAKVASDLAAANRIVNDIQGQKSLARVFSRGDEQLEKERGEAEKSAGEELADLGLYHAISVPSAGAADLERIIDALNALDVVEVAHATPMPFLANPDIAPATQLFSGQAYLDAAPLGIDARYAWTKPGGRGDGVRIIDVEFSWRLDHEDLPSVFHNGSGASGLFDPNGNHGTAVLGILAAQENGYGFTGIAPRAAIGVSTWLSVVGIAGAIDDAAGLLRRGDVLVIEIHFPGPTTNLFDAIGGSQNGFVPVEYFPAVFDAVRRATARGVIVVAAAGNGAVDLDAPVYERRFDRSVRDSGAILVGAGTPGGGVPEWFTNYGSRVDVHGWGSGVDSLGYGDMTVPGAAGDVRQWYTRTFGGTSSATPIVAGAAADIQGALMARGATPLSPADMRRYLRDLGTPQAADARQIGPLPDLRRTLDVLLPSPPPPSTWPSLGGRIIAAPAVGRTADDRLMAFAIGTDGRLWNLAQTAPNGAFSGWSSLGENGLRPNVRFVGRPAVASGADRRLEVFVRGDDNHIWHIYQNGPNGAWSGWDDMGGNATSDPAVGANDNGRLEVFFRGADAQLYHNWQMWPNGGWFTFGWQALGGNLQGAPAVVQNADRRLQVFVRGTGNALQSIAQRAPGNGWNGWAHHGGVFTSDPEAILASTSLGVVWQVFARGTDGQVWVTWQTAPNGGGFQMGPFGGALPEGSRVAVCQRRDGGATVLARFTDGSVQERHQDPSTGGWTSWTNHGGGVIGDPAVGIEADGRLDVLAMGADRSLVRYREP